MRRTFSIYFTLGLRSILFYVAVLLVPFACLTSPEAITMYGANDKILIQHMFLLGDDILKTEQMYSSIGVFRRSFFPNFGLFLPLISVFPSVILYCEELRGFNKLEIFRLGRKKYILGRLTASASLAFCAIFSGLMILYGILNLKFPNLSSYSIGILEGHPMSYWNLHQYIDILGGVPYAALMSMGVAFLGAVLSIFCMFVATLVPNKFFAIGIPVVVFKIISNMMYTLYATSLLPFAPFILNPEHYVHYSFEFIKINIGGFFPFWVYPTIVFCYGIVFTILCVWAFYKRTRKY